ncbi:hypothetical protein ACH3O9_07385 [Leeuwenhoekiella sp. A16]|uniref:hypothetical protein n=1 Tax=unclassified Leeuwenhoekiella TaxID=2615029 RepID=UPI003A8030ED|tara:strand:- start:786 stop:1205 length:420 start_codon:yes stop_codon:yes gene_type:complete
MKKIYFYDSFSRLNLIYIAVCLLILGVSTYFIWSGANGQSTTFLIAASYIVLLFPAKIAYERRHEYVVHYSPYKISFKLKHNREVISLKNLRTIKTKGTSIELNMKDGKSHLINTALFTNEDVCQFLDKLHINNKVATA